MDLDFAVNAILSGSLVVVLEVFTNEMKPVGVEVWNKTKIQHLQVC